MLRCAEWCITHPSPPVTVLAPSNTQVERVLHARVPVLKFLHALTGLRCDFSIQRPECTFKADMQK